MAKKALIAVDVQNDFCSGGALGINGGEEIVGTLNYLIFCAMQKGWDIYFSRDWHPKKTKHFEKWPAHCVKKTFGAQFQHSLYVPSNYINFRLISKGLGDNDDYSVFDTGLRPKAKELYVAGLATDYCVLWTVKKAIELGYKVTIIIDACRPVNKETGEKAVEEMQFLGAIIMNSREVLDELEK